jgi:hypothetical protein
VFTVNSWILPTDFAQELGTQELVDAFTRRESSWCRRCGANLRVRRMADVLLHHYAVQATTLVQLIEEEPFGHLRIAEINGIGAAHEFLARHPGVAYTEYPEEDLTRLSYGDAEFDLVLTADTLEHVPEYHQALLETRRVLRVGGRHVFTIPVVPTRGETVVRATRDSSGTLVHHLPPLYHGRSAGPYRILGGRSDFLAYTDFGLDVLQLLKTVGFDPELHFHNEENPESDTALVFCGRAV